MSNPIYEELADRRGVDVPENPIDWAAPTPPRYPTPHDWAGWADEDGSVYTRAYADEFEYGGSA